jgi:hypothetical protein
VGDEEQGRGTPRSPPNTSSLVELGRRLWLLVVVA